MKKSRKLTRYISWRLGVIAFIMIAAYSILLFFSLFKGVEEAATFDLKLISRDFDREYEKNNHTPLPRFHRLRSYIGEKDLPAWLNKKSPANLNTGEILIAEPTLADYEKDQWAYHVVFPYELYNGKRLYLIQTYTEKDDIPDTFMFSENLEILILGTGILFILIIMAGVQLLFRNISTALEDLSSWAANLNSDNLENPKPEFKFREIRFLSDLIHNAVFDLNDTLKREHHFLKHASHELRTPIAILRSNMDLIGKIKPDPDDNEKIIYERIRRASDNMQQITETLLWLSRKEETMPAPEPVDVQELVTGLIHENEYLLEGKDVRLILDTEPASLTVPLTACRIAMGNLIRNAFQYTSHGKIQVRLTQTGFSITNQINKAHENDKNDHGFGLGLMLVKQICRKLNLSYEKQDLPGRHRAFLSWN